MSLKIGDAVTVPGNMHGTLKYLGPVQNKRGIFAGVQLAPEFASRGKNSGDVEGKHYFRTTTPGSGIFLPSEKAEKRSSLGAHGGGTPIAALGGFNQGGRTPSAMHGQSLPKPNFSQSIGPGGLAMRSASPMTVGMKPPGMRRESLPRPSSPLRKNNPVNAHTPAAGRLATPRTRPSLGLNKSTIGAPGTVGGGMKSPGLRQPSAVTGNKFGQSLRTSTRGAATPSRLKKTPGPPRSDVSMSTTTTDTSPLGPESAFDEEESQLELNEGADSTPTPAAGRNFKSAATPSVDSGEARRLKEQLAERDRQLSEQAASIREMEGSLSELQQLMMSGSGFGSSANHEDDEDLPKDVQLLRASLRDKNERIKALTAEFDANRADFRSTIDTLEMASTETERVYEKRVDDLLEELRIYQEKNEDVESVAQQFKQLEELVQELEEGLEDARRGEAEARGEVEFLRGEVERGRSELRREKERSRTGDRLNGIVPDGGGISTEEMEELQLKVEQKDDEIRGLRAIVQNLNDAAAARSPDRERTPKTNGGGGWSHGHSKTKSTNTVVSLGQSFQEDTDEHLQQQIRDLEVLLDSDSFSKEQIREEVSKLRQSVHFGNNGGPKMQVPGLGISQHSRTISDLQKTRSGASSASTTRPDSFKTTDSSTKSSYHSGHRRKDTGVPEFVDAVSSPLREEFGDGERHGPQTPGQAHNSHTPDAKSVSGYTDVSSNNALWCEICEEPGHDILTCSNMGFGPSEHHQQPQQSPFQSRPSTTGTAANSNNLNAPSGKDVVREGLRRSRESPHPPPNTEVPPPPVRLSAAAAPNQKDMDRPAPLSMGSRSNSSYTPTSPSQGNKINNAISASTTTNKRDTPTSMVSSAPNGGAVHQPQQQTSQPSPTTTTANNLIEGTGDQAGMLAGRESGVIDASKWCALCEKDGHDSVDCPLEMAF